MGSIENPAPSVANVITVGTGGADYASIKDAMDSITASGPTNRYLLDIGPGVFVEDNPITLKQFVHLNGSGANATRIEASNANLDLFDSADFVILTEMAFSAVSGTGWVIDITDAHNLEVSNCAFFNCGNGLRVNHASAVIAALHNDFLVTSGTTACGYCNNAGNLAVNGGGIAVAGAGAITELFDLDGANAITSVFNFLSFSASVSTCVHAANDARSVFGSCSFVGMTDGWVLESGSDTRGSGVSIFLAQNDGVRITNTGSGTNFVAEGVTAEDSTGFDLNVLSATASVSGNGISAIDNWNFVPGAELVGFIVDLKEDDEGTKFFGEIHGGAAEQGSESVFGQGDSYTRGMLVYTFNPSGSVWTDVSAAARSASGSTFTFPDVAQNNAIYVASSLAGADVLQHYGIKASVTTAAVLGAGLIIAEYWDGGAWVAFNTMSTLSGTPYTQFADRPFERVESDQVRYDNNILSPWTKNDPVTPAIATDYYWMRWRISTAITTAPIFEQFKLHTSRFEINADGVTEYFGPARYPRDLLVHIALSDALAGAAPSNVAVAFASGITLTITRNGFNNNSFDGFGEVVVIPDGLDTSMPLELGVAWYPDTNNAGDVELAVGVAQLEEGDLLDGSAARTDSAQVLAVPANDQYVSRITTFEIDISELVPGEALVFRVTRDATVGNDPPDTLAGNIVVANLRLVGTFWRP